MQSRVHTHSRVGSKPSRRFSLATLIGLARSRRALAQLDEARLKDLGLSSHDAQVEANRPFWDVPAHWVK